MYDKVRGKEGFSNEWCWVGRIRIKQPAPLPHSFFNVNSEGITVSNVKSETITFLEKMWKMWEGTHMGQREDPQRSLKEKLDKFDFTRLKGLM